METKKRKEGRRYRRRKCRRCKEWFMPQAHNAYHQRYCTEPDCCRASHRRSQRLWLRKNPGYHRDCAGRVREWRQAHPGYGKGGKRLRTLRITVRIPVKAHRKRAIRVKIDDPETGALQDLSLSVSPDTQRLASDLIPPLRDLYEFLPRSRLQWRPRTRSAIVLGRRPRARSP